ncbi:MAG: large conductance mechanosensitive channel protein MscL [Ruminococcaceae bacterium]|nr:large conductance mechanosensitive channel protein MscL [Oscillospiraceae bacterium]
MKKLLKEFRDFAVKGNALNLAVGVLIGGAFQGIVNSLVNDIISPVIGLFGKSDFSAYILTINGVEIKYGSFITAIINFLILAFVIFMIVKGVNSLTSLGKKKEEPVEEEPTTKVCPFCQSEISIKAIKCPHCTSEIEA